MSLLEIDLIRQDFFKERFVKELEYLEQDKQSVSEDDINNKEGINWIDKRMDDLKNIITNIDGELELSKKEYQNKSKTLNKELDELNQCVYKKSWTRLPIYHKTIKMEEYIDYIIPDSHKDMQKELITVLTDIIESKKLNSIKQVEYDSTNCKIIKINILTIDLDKKEYKIAT
jgi:hypothetical protein